MSPPGSCTAVRFERGKRGRPIRQSEMLDGLSRRSGVDDLDVSGRSREVESHAAQASEPNGAETRDDLI